MPDTILFELRVTERGIAVYESDVWRAYHEGRTRPKRTPRRPPAARHALRARLDALQTIYNDLYGSTAEA